MFYVYNICVILMNLSNEGDKIEVTRENTDSIVFSVINKFMERSTFGMKKYGTNLDRTDLSVLDWIQHAQEEHMDAILYLEKLKKEIGKENKS
jgi:hypothetical protein